MMLICIPMLLVFSELYIVVFYLGNGHKHLSESASSTDPAHVLVVTLFVCLLKLSMGAFALSIM